jgi:hypothetical protein
LSYSVFDHLQRVSHAAIIENKRLGEVLAWIKQQQENAPLARELASQAISGLSIYFLAYRDPGGGQIFGRRGTGPVGS